MNRKLLLYAAISLALTAASAIIPGLSLPENTWVTVAVPPEKEDCASCIRLQAVEMVSPCYLGADIRPGRMAGRGVPLQYIESVTPPDSCASTQRILRVNPLGFFIDFVVWLAAVVGIMRLRRPRQNRDPAISGLLARAMPTVDPLTKAWRLTILFTLIGGLTVMALCLVINEWFAEIVFKVLTGYTNPSFFPSSELFAVLLGVLSVCMLLMWLNTRIAKASPLLAKQAYLWQLWPVVFALALPVFDFLTTVNKQTDRPSGGAESLGTTIVGGAWIMLVYLIWFTATITRLIKNRKTKQL